MFYDINEQKRKTWLNRMSSIYPSPDQIERKRKRIFLGSAVVAAILSLIVLGGWVLWLGGWID